MPKKLKKILIVEDENSISRPLQLKLEKENFQVLVADNGKKGLALALKEKPDLILLDMVMPIMDGATMLEKLRQDPLGKKINIIMLTNLAHLDSEFDPAKYKVADYLIKSQWKISNLIKKIKIIVKQ